MVFGKLVSYIFFTSMVIYFFKIIYPEKSYDHKNMIILIGVIALTLFFAFINLFLNLSSRNLSKDKKEKYQEQLLISAKEEKSITSEYLLSYVLPLCAFDFTKYDQVVEFLFFYLILGYLCVKHSHFSVNIVLDFCGFRLYDCELQNVDHKHINKIVISKRKLNMCVGEDIYIKSINNNYRLDVFKKQ